MAGVNVPQHRHVDRNGMFDRLNLPSLVRNGGEPPLDERLELLHDLNSIIRSLVPINEMGFVHPDELFRDDVVVNPCELLTDLQDDQPTGFIVSEDGLSFSGSRSMGIPFEHNHDGFPRLASTR